MATHKYQTLGAIPLREWVKKFNRLKYGYCYMSIQLEGFGKECVYPTSAFEKRMDNLYKIKPINFTPCGVFLPCIPKYNDVYELQHFMEMVSHNEVTLDDEDEEIFFARDNRFSCNFPFNANKIPKWATQVIVISHHQ